MLIVIALGGNALLQRGECLEAKQLSSNCQYAATLIAAVAKQHQIVLVHGNGPQVGLLALQAEAYKAVKPYPFDILNAESQGMIGYLLQHELSNQLPHQSIVTVLTQVIVSTSDPAFSHPTKPIGPLYTALQAKKIHHKYPWILKQEGSQFRRVVASPIPLAIHELLPIKLLLQQGILVIAGGGGGIPCAKNEQAQLIGLEAVVDKDLTASLLARKLQAERFIILTDIDAVYTEWGTAGASAIICTTPQYLKNLSFAEGSMQPKIAAACQFVNSTGRQASIGHLKDLANILEQTAGTHIVPN